MHHIRRIRCNTCGSSPLSEASKCAVCGGFKWNYQCERHGLPATEGLGCERCGYSFAGKLFFDPASLAVEILIAWDEALDAVQRRPLAQWADDGLQDTLLAKRLRSFTSATTADPEIILSASLVTLNPSAQLHWRGSILSPTDLSTSGLPMAFEKHELARKILCSQLPEWTHDVPACRWLSKIQTQCRLRAKAMGIAELLTVAPLQWWWLLAVPSALQATLTQIRGQYFGGRDERLGELFTKKELTELEIVEFASASKDRFITADDFWLELGETVMAKMTELEGSARHRPCSREELEIAEREFQQHLDMLREWRERLRRHQLNLLDPIGLAEAVERARMALRESRVAHNKARSSIQHLRQLIARGHVRYAVRNAASVRLKISEFSDLDLEFVRQAEHKLIHTRRKLISFGIVLTICIILMAIIIKLFARTNPSTP